MVALAPALRHLRLLTQLDLGRNAAQEEGLVALAPSVGALRGLRHLDLAGNNMGRLAAAALAPALSQLTALTYVSLRSMADVRGSGEDVKGQDEVASTLLHALGGAPLCTKVDFWAADPEV